MAEPVRKRTYNVRLIKASWPYTVQEIAELFRVHKNAPLRWLRQGLRADRSRRPFLIRGDELARFLSARKQNNRRKCAVTEFYCFKCRCPRDAYLGIADIVIESPSRFRLKALCAVCSTPVNKAQAMRDMSKIRERFEIQQLVGEHILERADASVNVDSERPNEDAP